MCDKCISDDWQSEPGNQLFQNKLPLLIQIKSPYHYYNFTNIATTMARDRTTPNCRCKMAVCLIPTIKALRSVAESTERTLLKASGKVSQTARLYNGNNPTNEKIVTAT